VIAPPGRSVRFPPTVKMPLADPSASRGEPSRLDSDSCEPIVTFPAAKIRRLATKRTESASRDMRIHAFQCFFQRFMALRTV
jgi:hypothetical protein